MIEVSVRPRVLRLDETATAPALIDEVIRDLLDVGAPKLVRVDGPSGCGKSMALRYLKDSIGATPNLRIIDDAEMGRVPLAPEHGVLVYASSSSLRRSYTTELRMAPWTRDDLVEYLLAKHPECCRSVLKRVSVDGDAEALEGSPELWVIAIEEMVRNPRLVTIEHALRTFCSRLAPESLPPMRAASLWDCICGEIVNRDQGDKLDTLVEGLRWTHPAAARLFHHTFIRQIMGADQLVNDLLSKNIVPYLNLRLPDDMILRVSAVLASRKGARVKLEKQLKISGVGFPTAVELLHAMDLSWLGEYLTRCHAAGRPTPILSRARIPCASARNMKAQDLRFAYANCSGGDWSGAVLDRASLYKADFTECNLEGAQLSGIRAPHARFVRANLRNVFAPEASFGGADLRRACLAGADLRAAYFGDARLGGADLHDADLTDADLSDAEFTGAHLENARLLRTRLSSTDLRHTFLQSADFTEAVLKNANLEGVVLKAPIFAGANLKRASLTASVMPGADFQRANLCETGLADVDWPGANLLGANLTHCSFHMGSSRSGKLVGYPSQGTRTGFYTDDEKDQGFKAPEEIRKANLCGADLRGAKVHDADFYLVDLRDALYTPDQAKHFRRCGAILKRRV